MTSSDQAEDFPGKQSAALTAYTEICRSYHAIDDFRMKLLGMLPLASLVGVFLIDKSTLLSNTSGAGDAASELVGFAAVFAAMLTLALFGYEVRGIQRCHNPITEGKHLEEWLGIGHGQFHICQEEHEHPTLRALNAKFIACIIYSLVFSGWFFMALRFGLGYKTATCVIWAAGAGLVIATITYLAVRKLTSA